MKKRGKRIIAGFMIIVSLFTFADTSKNFNQNVMAETLAKTENVALEKTDTAAAVVEDQYSISDLLNKKYEKKATTSPKDWITNDKKIDYPIKPNSKEWKNFSTHEKMVAACTIPDEIIQKMSTQQLLKVVMNYPLLSDLYYYDTYEQGLYALASEFNGLRELLKREDGITSIIEYYENYIIPSKAATTEKVINELKDKSGTELDEKLTEVLENEEKVDTLLLDFKTVANIELAEVILVNDVTLDTCNEKQKEKIADIACKKYSDKVKSDLFTGKEAFIYKAADDVNNTSVLGTVEKESSNLVTASSPIYVYTPRGSAVPVTTSLYNGDAWAASFDLDTKLSYPAATFIRSSDNRYNCHSYAWYSSSWGNVYWMDSPYAYINDGSYKKITNTSERGANNRVLWYQYPSVPSPYIHSGILTGINSDGSYNIYSKWGEGPVMLHTAGYSPYSGTRYYYKAI